ncbi:SagB family peptide dehydrogenase [Nocardia sp. NPDC051052]|uniref:SagB family peptide dehydrogenase n=1 Tax=Nocardia sp. NPDC051052 TaxID=3364322 RepID=UPI0037A6433B
MSAVTYPDQTRYALRAGVTCLTTSAGATLLYPPRNEQLSGLGLGQLQALRTLNRGPATVSQLSDGSGTDDVAGLMDRLTDGGWLSVTVRDGGRNLYSIQPFGQPPPRPVTRLPWRATLSKFAVLHRDSDGFVLEHPLSWCDVRIHDPRLLSLLDGFGAAESPLHVSIKSQLAADLHWCGFLVADPDEEEREFTTRGWHAADLWFHRRSTLGERTASSAHAGAPMWAVDTFPQPPTRKPHYPGEPVPLATPDLAVLRANDPTLAAVLAGQQSTHAIDDANPITRDQLAELLFGTAGGVRSTSAESAARPHPSAGSVDELELYPIVRHVDGLAPGMYHYDSFDHVLRPVADLESPAVQRLLATASVPLAEGGAPQLVLLLAARSGHLTRNNGQVAYADILKHVGAVTQTVSVIATAMGLGACAQGFSDTAAFAAAANVDELAECAVGSIIVGSPAHDR